MGRSVVGEMEREGRGKSGFVQGLSLCSKTGKVAITC